MADAVIVSTSRTPIGRANKGSLVDARPDDMSAHTLSDVLSKVDMDPNEVEDVIWGIGQPGGEGGYNIARVISAQQGLDLPGVTVNRYCSSSLQTIRMAAHAIMAGEGDCFVAGAARRLAASTAAVAEDADVVRAALSVRQVTAAAASSRHRRVSSDSMADTLSHIYQTTEKGERAPQVQNSGVAVCRVFRFRFRDYV